MRFVWSLRRQESYITRVRSVVAQLAPFLHQILYFRGGAASYSPFQSGWKGFVDAFGGVLASVARGTDEDQVKFPRHVDTDRCKSEYSIEEYLAE